MRLSDVLSKAPDGAVYEIEGFLGGRPLPWGRHRNIAVGKVFHNFNCQQCEDQRSFQSGNALACLGLGNRAVSIDATLKCPGCAGAIEVWFVIRSENDIFSQAPHVRIERYTEHLRDLAERIGEIDGPFADLVKRAHLAYQAGLGAGSMVYLRWILESITYEVAEIAGIQTTGKKGGRVPFKDVLERVNEERSIIPQRFSSNGYKLFGELSEVIHGSSSEGEALKKFTPCLQLVLGVVEEVNRDNVFAKAIDELGWGVDDIDEIAGESS